jgi:hypothetical protein
MNMIHNWTDLQYLLKGNPVQREVYHLLDKYRIMQCLESFHPMLVGTIPIGIHVENSDLDIICEVDDHTTFDALEALAGAHFQQYRGYTLVRRQVDDVWRLKVNFWLEQWPVEVFAQQRLVTEQNGYRHMVIEDRLLRLYGDKFRQQVIALKSEGLKTEPVFAKLLQLDGDPYSKLLELETWDDEQLRALWEREARSI